MQKKNILLTAALTGMIVCAAACGGNGSGTTTAAPANTGSPISTINEWDSSTVEPAETTALDTVEATEETAASEAPVIDPKNADYSKVDVTIPFDSGELIVDFTNDMLAGKYDGKIVKCDGITGSRMNGCAMMQKQSDGSSRGFTWYLVDSTDYPADDSRCEITGIVGIGDYDVRYLYVLPENVVLKTGNADNSAADSPLRKGVWWAVADGGGAGYYYFRDGGEGEYRDQQYGIGYGFSYELDSDGTSGSLTLVGIDGSLGEKVPFSITAIDDNSFRLEMADYIEILTLLSEDTESFEFYSTTDLAEMAKWYYNDLYDYIPSCADSELQADGTVTIHLYDVVDDHTTTAAWYYIDRFTAAGKDMNDAPVDLEPYGRTYQPNGKPRPASWHPTVIQRQLLLDENAILGVRYLGWIDPEANDFDAFKVYIDNILEYTGTAEDFPFVKELPADRFVSTQSGSELYLIIPQSSSASVFVYPQLPTDDEYVGDVTPLYECLDGEPFLLKCNVSEIYADVKVCITMRDSSTEWRPGISGKDGTVLTNNLNDCKIYDFTDYDRLAGTEQAPLG